MAVLISSQSKFVTPGGACCASLINHDRAIEYYELALKINPDYAQAHNNLANSYKEKGSLLEAIQSYHLAISINPNFSEAFNNLGNAYKECNQIENAIDSYLTAIEHNIHYAEAFNNLGIVLNAVSYTHLTLPTKA